MAPLTYYHDSKGLTREEYAVPVKRWRYNILLAAGQVSGEPLDLTPRDLRKYLKFLKTAAFRRMATAL